MCATEGEERRRCERFRLDAQIEFFVDADIIEATSLEVSQTGISFDTGCPLPVEMRVTLDGEREERRARLVWARAQPHGGIRYGLEFIPGEEEPESRKEIDPSLD